MVDRVHYWDTKTPPLVPILSYINSVHTLPSHFLQVHFNIILTSILRIQSSPVPSSFPIKILHAPPLSPLCAARPTHLFFHDCSSFIAETKFHTHKKTTAKLQFCIIFNFILLRFNPFKQQTSLHQMAVRMP